ncbi:hypothetical protein [Prevotella sp.]|uniref:hypothetical protein n=1 Tax=Prevotella sp. TaxID=59823 RepID=UPI003FD6F219
MKGINHKYIILQRRKLKIFLNAGSEPWEAPIGNKWYQIDVWLESLFASWIFDYGYVGYIGDITSYLADRYNKGVTPVHVQHFIDYFKASHKVEKLDDCSLKDVFLLGDDIEGCPVPIYKYDCAITKEDEQMLLGKIQNNQATAKKILEDFFSMHMIRFNQSYYPKWGDRMEAKYLADNFLAMHGIRVRDNQIQKKTTAGDLWITALVCCIMVTLIFTVANLCGLLNGWTKWIVFFIASPCYFIMLNTSLKYSTTRKSKKK